MYIFFVPVLVAIVQLLSLLLVEYVLPDDAAAHTPSSSRCS